MDRRDFLKGTGGLVVSFSFSTRALAQNADSGRPIASPKPMGKNQLDAWLSIGKDGRVMVYSGKVDLGTGTRTALAQMVADELDVAFDRIELVMGDTLLTVDQGQTAGSLTIQDGGSTLRRAAACARRAMTQYAAARWGVPPETLTVSNGIISAGPERQIPYTEVVAAQSFDVPLDSNIPLKPPGSRRLVGQSVSRVDIPDKLSGRFTYMQDFKLPGMLHARVIRPSGPAARLVGFDAASVKGVRDLVRIVHKENYLAVVCKSEWSAVKAARMLKVKWQGAENFPDQSALTEYWRSLPVRSVERPAAKGQVSPALDRARQRLKATYTFAPHTHGSIGPACAVADFREGRCTIWSASQATHSLQGEIASVLGVDKAQVRLIYLDGAGCYGRNGHEDCAADAAFISQAIAQPVRVQWMRADEHAWDPKSPPTVVDLEGGIDENGRPTAWKSDFYLAAAQGTLSEFPLLAATLSGQKRTGYITAQIQKNAEVLYAFPNIATNVHRLQDRAFRTSHLRSPGRLQNAFANEAFFDEMATAAGADPLAWRLEYLSDPRARAVLEDVARMSAWQYRPAPTPAQLSGGSARGRGLAFVRYDNDRTYVATVLDVEVDLKSGKVRVTDVWCSHDCGRVINPDGACNQIEGGIVQTISRVLLEEVRFDRDQITTTDWATYPILRFPEAPNISISLIDRPEAVPWGVGEMAPATIPGAISNAVFNATGLRMRSVPFLPEKVLALLK
ncbi:molybdopterin cofactor-binding domain-containing protein [Cupriavidus sp. DF5525]|uniref:xanthine dehydrogenase family protein molybdopterin-binding subunit n=1 Tax=Cupriavidus sp. DF5525 TaxID=3160989 RepID=UPI0032DF0738